MANGEGNDRAYGGFHGANRYGEGHSIRTGTPISRAIGFSKAKLGKSPTYGDVTTNNNYSADPIASFLGGVPTDANLPGATPETDPISYGPMMPGNPNSLPVGDVFGSAYNSKQAPAVGLMGFRGDPIAAAMASRAMSLSRDSGPVSSGRGGMGGMQGMGGGMAGRSGPSGPSGGPTGAPGRGGPPSRSGPSGPSAGSGGGYGGGGRTGGAPSRSGPSGPGAGAGGGYGGGTSGGQPSGPSRGGFSGPGYSGGGMRGF